MRNNLIFTIAALLFLNSAANADGVSPYLPLKTDPLFELELERLATIADLPVLSKPYHAATVNNYLSKVKNSHPKLYGRIYNYLKRYKKSKGITHYQATLAYSSKENYPLANQRGQDVDSKLSVSVNSFYQVNNHFIINGGGTFREGNGFVSNNTFASFGWDVFQVDLGYREHWLSPFQEAAVLLSTQAEPILNATISNVSPLTDWKIKYEMSVGILSESEKIKYLDKLTTGEPGFMSMHLSFQPFDNWTLGANRTYMFGGGGRSIDFSDIWNAIIDPVNSDNCGGAGTDLQDCTQEVGNQIASITSKVNFSLFDQPISFNYEFAGEDTRDHKNYRLGNLSESYGFFFPYLTEDITLNLEYTKFHEAWYVHHIYGDGYANEGHKMGHWWGDIKEPSDPGRGNATNVRVVYEYSPGLVFNLSYRGGKFEDAKTLEKTTSQEVELAATLSKNKHFYEFNIASGEDKYGDSYIRTAVTVRW